MQINLGNPQDPKYANIYAISSILKKLQKNLISVITSVILNAHL